MPEDISGANAGELGGSGPVPSAVVFDVGRVLIQWNLRFLFEKLISDRDELDWFLVHVVSEEWHSQVDEGRNLAEMVAARKVKFPDHAPLIDAYAARFLETAPAHIDGTLALVERLAKAQVPIFGLTNFGVEFWAMFRPKQPIFDLFSEIVVSGAEKCVKPDPRIYEIAEARFGHDPQDLFFIDDKAENIDAATARGWHGHVFVDAAGLEAALFQNGLLT